LSTVSTVSTVSTLSTMSKVSYFPALTTWPTTDWSLFSKQRRKIYKILHLVVNIYPWPVPARL
jgi:hypothetical protein